jgi:ATP-dependent helicase HrpA
MSLRLTKLPNAPGRDSQLQAELTPIWHRCLAAMKHLDKLDASPPRELQDFRWMIEELRVSLFAQELKTIHPVSVKRLEKQWGGINSQVGAHR